MKFYSFFFFSFVKLNTWFLSFLILHQNFVNDVTKGFPQFCVVLCVCVCCLKVLSGHWDITNSCVLSFLHRKRLWPSLEMQLEKCFSTTNERDSQELAHTSALFLFPHFVPLFIMLPTIYIHTCMHIYLFMVKRTHAHIYIYVCVCINCLCCVVVFTKYQIYITDKIAFSQTKKKTKINLMICTS